MRRFLHEPRWSALVVLAAAACGGCGGSEVPAARAVGAVSRDARTAVLVVVDSLRRDHLTPYGYELATTPNLEELAREALVFGDCVSVCSGVNGGLASLLTGQYAQEHGVGSLSHRGQHRLAEQRTTLAEVYSAAGWSTLAVVSMPQLRADLSGLAQGFDEYIEPALREGPLRTAEQSYYGALPRLQQALAADGPLFLMLHLADTGARSAAEGVAGTRFVRAHMQPFGEQNTLIRAALQALDERPESALEDLEQLLRRGRNSPAHLALRAAAYDSRLAAVDEVLGELLELLAKSGRLERAALAVTSTRGALLAPPPSSGGPDFDPRLVAAPFVLRCPGGVPAGRVSELVRSVDVAPTLAALCGLSWPVSVAGRDLLPLVEGEGDPGGPAILEATGLDRRAVLGPGLQLEENRVAGTVLYGRDGARVMREDELSEGLKLELGELRDAMASWPVRADLLLESGGLELDVRWRFCEGFAGAARVEGTGAAREAHSSGLSGRAKLQTHDRLLFIGASRRELPLRLQLSDRAGDLEQGRILIGGCALERSLLPRLAAADAPPWPLDEDGQPRPAKAVLEHQTGTWWRLTVAAPPEGRAPVEVEALVALFPSPSLQERLEWGADAGLDIEALPGRDDAIRVRGQAPFSIQLQKKPSQEFGLALRLDGKSLSGAEIRYRERRFSEPGEVILYLPDWLAGVTDDLLEKPTEPVPPGHLRLTRRGPNLAAGERSPMDTEQRAFVHSLGAGQ